MYASGDELEEGGRYEDGELEFVRAVVVGDVEHELAESAHAGGRKTVRGVRRRGVDEVVVGCVAASAGAR